ncbi:MAG: DNA polymerase/3'-5' exonuclease PolX, partial [Deltaproteobacteria bacterium]|nr:DNA polymerase/3'-5' exonuclease PolX [Deltaproteobacteria bacterium]
MNKHDIASVLAEMAIVFELKGENPFKIRAYENAARVVEGMDDLELRIKDGTLTEVKGIGKNLADHITELYKNGRIKEYESLRKSVPAGLFDMLAIPGLGPKKVKFLWEVLSIKEIGGLELACKHGALRKHKGFGQKTEEKILQGIAYLRRNLGQHLYSSALLAALEVYDAVSEHPFVIRAEIAGSIRRKKEVIKDIDIVASTNKPDEVMKFFTSLPMVERTDAKGGTKSAVILKSGISADLRAVSDAEFPYALHHFTGSKEHNVAMRSRAIKMGMKMNEYGLFKGRSEKLVVCKDEAEIYKNLGLSFIPPELRENMGEIEAAEKGRLPELLNEKDITGVLHVHTNKSDGVNSVEEVALAAKKLGYSYVGICDHSQSASYAGGLKPPDIKRQWKEIEKLNSKLKGIAILRGIECDILQDGSLDYPNDILKGFDFVIVSIHSRFNMAEDEMTNRVIKAFENPYSTILGHPTGRLLLSREPYKIDMHKVIEAAAKHGVAIELNANSHR